jgi:hypothetical protein
VRVQRIILGTSPAVALFAFLHACSSSDTAVSNPQDGGLSDSGEAGDVVYDVIVREAAAPPPGYDGGVGLGLADVEDTPCATRGGALATVLAPTDGGPAVPSFKDLRVVGSRRVATTTDAYGFVLFDADGKNANLITPITHYSTIAVAGDKVLVGGAEGEFVGGEVSVYDANGTTTGDPVFIVDGPEDPENMGSGSDGTKALFVWVPEAVPKIRARGFVGTAAVGDAPYELALGNYPATPSSVVAAVQPDLFAVVFNGYDLGDRWLTGFGRGSTTARVGDPTALFEGPVPRNVTGLVRTGNGLALLVNVNDGPKPYAMLVTMDVGGHRTSAGLKLVGTSGASAIAASTDGNTIGVLATRRETAGLATEFRPFALDGTPLGPWVCLETPGTEPDLGGGLVADGTGWSAIFRAKDGSASLARFDHLGTGAP